MIKVRKYLLSMLIQRLTALMEVEEVGFYQMLYMDFLHRIQEERAELPLIKASGA